MAEFRNYICLHCKPLLLSVKSDDTSENILEDICCKLADGWVEKNEISIMSAYTASLAVGSPCFWALGLMMPQSDFHLTTLVSASSSYTTSHASHDDDIWRVGTIYAPLSQPLIPAIDDDDDIWQTSSMIPSKVLWDILNRDLNAFKYCVCELFHNPLLMRSKCEECVMCVRLYLCGRGFPVNLLFPTNLWEFPPTYGNFLMNCGNVQRLAWFWEDVDGWRGQARHDPDWSNSEAVNLVSRNLENTSG